ncbi:MAG: PatB family C-S lyase, partial [Clostridiales bacterium]|nr:PatB family C-S lyase [Clostridiales bacterium]
MEELIYRDRRGTRCSKWNELGRKFSRDDLMGLWVADMDFATAACVREALRRQVDFGVFGYDIPSEGYYRAFMNWEKTSHGYEVQREWLRYSPGVVAAFNWFVQLLTQPGDAVLIQTPVYYPFMFAATDHGRKLIKNELRNTDGVYSVDFEDFERKIVEEQVKIFLLCSPHNPVGRVWQMEELRQMLDICRAHGVYVIADEIHHDFIHGENRHIPAATVGVYDDMLVTLTSPSKTFNLAGLKNSVIIIPAPRLRCAYDDYTKKLHVDTGNSVGFVAAEAAYDGGRPWLESVLQPVWGKY